MNKLLLVLILLLFLSSLASAKRLYSWGTASDISLNTETKCLTSYENIKYCYNNSGEFNVYKDGLHQGSISFGLFGTVNDAPQKKLMNDFYWTWQVIEDTPEKISVKAYNNFPEFQWWMDLNIERYSPLKITHTVKNNSGYDIENAQLFYIIDVNQETNPYIYYEKIDGTIYQYDYSQNYHFTDQDTDFEEYYSRVRLGNFKFLFSDLIENNFFITRAYFGNLNQLDEYLPDTNGFAVGVSKGNEVIYHGITVESDPRITVASADDIGYIRYENGAYDITYTGLSAIQTGVSYSGGDYKWTRSVFQFDGVTSKTSDANLFVGYANKYVVDANTCVFDLNSVTDLGTIGDDDWSSEVFEKVKDDWFDETIDADINTSVTTAWNNTVTAGRNYLAFRIGADDESLLDENACRIQLDAVGNMPYIEFTSRPDINVLQPNTSKYFSFNLNTTDGNALIDFNTSSPDDNYLYADIYYSSSAGAFTNAIVNDLNLYYYADNPTADINCTGNDFEGYIQCIYDFNFLSASDGNYFVDVNVFTSEGYYYSDSSDASFEIDSTAPTTSWDGNHNSWQSFDANVHLTCNDSGSGCSGGDANTTYRLDTDSATAISYGSWTAFDVNKLITADGNWAIDFNSTDVALNPGDVNTFYVLIDSAAPTTSNLIPATDTTGDEEQPTFSIDVADALSGLDKCLYTLFKGGENIATGVTTPSAGTCSYQLASAYALAPGQYALLQWDVNDSAGNLHGDQNTAIYTKSTGGSPEGGGGSGGGTITTTITEKLVYTVINPTTSMLNYRTWHGYKDYVTFTIRNEEDSEINVKFQATPEIIQFINIEEPEFTLQGLEDRDVIMELRVDENTTFGTYYGQIKVTAKEKETVFDVTIEVGEQTIPAMIMNALNKSVYGIPVIVIVIVVSVMIAVMYYDRKRMTYYTRRLGI